MAASTVGRSVVYTYTSAQCSPASLGLAQAGPNKDLEVHNMCQNTLAVKLLPVGFVDIMSNLFLATK